MVGAETLASITLHAPQFDLHKGAQPHWNASIKLRQGDVSAKASRNINQGIRNSLRKLSLFSLATTHSFVNMAPLHSLQTARSVVLAGAVDIATRSGPVLASRSLSKPNDAQKVTLGIIGLYVVVIALLWNLPFVRWSLWPFKVSLNLSIPPT